MKVEIKHYPNPDFPNKVEKTEKTCRVFGIVIFRKIYYYTRIDGYEVIHKF